jgi:hypothetical protein
MNTSSGAVPCTYKKNRKEISIGSPAERNEKSPDAGSCGAKRDEHYLRVCLNVADELLVEAQTFLGRAVPPHVIPALSRRRRGSPERELWEETTILDHC